MRRSWSTQSRNLVRGRVRARGRGWVRVRVRVRVTSPRSPRRAAGPLP